MCENFLILIYNILCLLDVIYVGNTNTQHFDVVSMALQNGKHVLCEKPLTLNAKQTNNLIALAKEKKRFLMEAIWSRCFPVYEKIQKEVNFLIEF